MKILHEEIEFCEDCPYCEYDVVWDEYVCLKDRNTINNHLGDNGIDILVLTPPDWCPLPDKGD